MRFIARLLEERVLPAIKGRDLEIAPTVQHSSPNAKVGVTIVELYRPEIRRNYLDE